MVLYVGLGVVAMAVVYGARGPLGDLFDAPGMGQYVLGFAISQLLDRARYVPERLIMRALRFRALATINGLGEIAFTAVALATVHGWGAYAIMFGCGRCARASPRSCSFAPRRATSGSCGHGCAPPTSRNLFRYGIPIMVAIVADRAATRWDNLIMSKLFDPGVMGRYNMSYSLAEMPIVNVAEHIGEVLMPSFSRMEPEQRERAVIRAAALMGVVVSPLGVGLGAVAPTVVATLFDARWAAMAPMLTILSIMTVFRPMTWSAIAYVQAVQRTRIVMISSFLRAIVVLSLVAVCGYAGGPSWACIGAGLGYALHSALTIIAVGRATGMRAGAYLRGVARPLLPCIPMFLAVTGIARILSAAGIPLVASLVVQIVTGAVVYIAAAFVLVRRDADELIRIGRDAIRRRR